MFKIVNSPTRLKEEKTRIDGQDVKMLVLYRLQGNFAHQIGKLLQTVKLVFWLSN